MGCPNFEASAFLSSDCEAVRSTMNVKFLREQQLSAETTHLIVGVLKPSEKLVSALARGIWILPQKYLVSLTITL